MVKIWSKDKILEEWAIASIITLHKKGPKTKCENLKGVVLFPTTYKILYHILLQKLTLSAEKIIEDYLCSFLKGRSTIDQMYYLRHLAEKREYGKNLFHLFADFKQEYDNKQRKSLQKFMKQFDNSKKLIKMAKYVRLH